MLGAMRNWSKRKSSEGKRPSVDAKAIDAKDINAARFELTQAAKLEIPPPPSEAHADLLEHYKNFLSSKLLPAIDKHLNDEGAHSAPGFASSSSAPSREQIASTPEAWALLERRREIEALIACAQLGVARDRLAETSATAQATPLYSRARTETRLRAEASTRRARRMKPASKLPHRPTGADEPDAALVAVGEAVEWLREQRPRLLEALDEADDALEAALECLEEGAASATMRASAAAEADEAGALSLDLSAVSLGAPAAAAEAGARADAEAVGRIASQLRSELSLQAPLDGPLDGVAAEASAALGLKMTTSPVESLRACHVALFGQTPLSDSVGSWSARAGGEDAADGDGGTTTDASVESGGRAGGSAADSDAGGAGGAGPSATTPLGGIEAAALLADLRKELALGGGRTMAEEASELCELLGFEAAPTAEETVLACHRLTFGETAANTVALVDLRPIATRCAGLYRRLAEKLPSAEASVAEARDDAACMDAQVGDDFLAAIQAALEVPIGLEMEGKQLRRVVDAQLQPLMDASLETVRLLRSMHGKVAQDQVPPEGLVAWYQPETWRDAQKEWHDASGHNHVGRVTHGSVSFGRAEGHGAKRVVGAVSGGTGASFDFGAVIKPQFTIASVCRYTGGARARILQGTRSNWLHSHWGSHRGVAHYDGWKTSSSSSVCAEHEWVVMIGQNCGEGILRANGVSVGTGGGGSGDQGLVINAGRHSGEKSDWAVSELLTWDRALTRDEIARVEAYLFGRLGRDAPDAAGAAGAGAAGAARAGAAGVADLTAADLAGTTWAWCHDGRRKNGVLELRADGTSHCFGQSTWHVSGPREVTVRQVGGAGAHKLYFNDELSGWFCSHSGQRGYREGRGLTSPDHAGAPLGALPVACGTYLIRTTHHGAGSQPAGWGLACFPNHGAKRDGASSWVHVHEGNHWPCRWEIRPAQQPGTYRIYTCGHADGGQAAGWGLSAWHAHGAERNGHSSWVAVHEGEQWPMDWKIVPGKQPNTWRFLTTHHAAGHQPEGWGLSAWNAHGAKRNEASSRVAVHQGDHWPMDWVLERLDAPKRAVPAGDAGGAFRKVTGTLSGAWLTGKTLRGVEGLPHAHEEHVWIFAVHEDGHTKMVAFRLSAHAAAAPVRLDGRAHEGKHEPIDRVRITDTWERAPHRGVPHENYKLTEIDSRGG